MYKRYWSITQKENVTVAENILRNFFLCTSTTIPHGRATYAHLPATAGAERARKPALEVYKSIRTDGQTTCNA